MRASLIYFITINSIISTFRWKINISICQITYINASNGCRFEFSLIGNRIRSAGNQCLSFLSNLAFLKIIQSNSNFCIYFCRIRGSHKSLKLFLAAPLRIKFSDVSTHKRTENNISKFRMVKSLFWTVRSN